ncbi:unnamed protein product [Rotaria sp. Silwood1]|nr:unnamed protein product [Rotaria sp. Silwood1]CAF3845031.1 unnamed protein product [Rotaria sp. Silwood1]CAF5094238.1 unnamed protein product [Rotaria sp. Silwood1]
MDDHRLNLVASTTDSIANVVNTSTKEKNEEITLIWFDENTNINTDDVIHIKEILCEVNDYVIFHEQEQKCIQYIESMKDEKIFFVCTDLSSTNT